MQKGALLRIEVESEARKPRRIAQENQSATAAGNECDVSEPRATRHKCFGRRDYWLVRDGGGYWANPHYRRRTSRGAGHAPGRIAVVDSWPSKRVTALPGRAGADLAAICRVLLRVLGHFLWRVWRIQVSLYSVSEAVREHRSPHRGFVFSP